MRGPRLLAAAVLLAVVAGMPALPQPSAWPSPKRAAPQRARFTAAPDSSLLVHGEYPPTRSSCVEPYQPSLHARFRGTVEVGREGNGSMFVIGELPFEDYLKGIAEVPRSWPMEALKAQVIAARSYATVGLSRSSDDEEHLGYDLCATDACQVYRGMGIEAGPWGGRWVEAVEATAGQILAYGGSPAETLYFSTSNGRTYGNEQIFGGSPLPYLRGVEESDDGESPLSRWRVIVPFDDLERLLAASGHWPGGDIERARWDGEVVRLRGDSRASLARDELRGALNDTAACLMPGRYPTTERDGYRYPQTVPSVWYRPRVEGGDLVLAGRGWGHGVGMVQWGAKGKADRGLSAADILAIYYGGLRPQPVQPPGAIRVLIARGLTSLVVAPSGDAQVSFGREEPHGPPWVVTAGRGLRVRRAPSVPVALTLDDFSASRRVVPGQEVSATFITGADVRARLEVLRDGRVIARAPWRPFDDNEVTLVAATPEDPGRYEVRAVASDGVDTLTTETVPLRVSPGAPAGTIDLPSLRPDSPEPGLAQPADEEDGGPPWAIAAAAVLALVLLVLLTRRRRTGLHRDR